MGLISDILGLGGAVKEVAEVFVPNKTKSAEYDHLEHKSALEQFAAEFKQSGGWFDSFVNGLNRLPRPILALGTVGLFGFSMIDPIAFSKRMVGLDTVPRELWWLLGAIVSFYFGARELHYVRSATMLAQPVPTQPVLDAQITPSDNNPVVANWMQSRAER
jgi:hypothetical protein